MKTRNALGYLVLSASAALFFLGIYLVLTETMGQQTGRYFLPQKTVIGQILVGLSGVFCAIGSVLVSGFLNSWSYTRSLLERLKNNTTRESIRNAAILMAFVIFSSYAVKGMSSHPIDPPKNVIVGMFGNLLFSVLYALSFGAYVLTNF